MKAFGTVTLVEGGVRVADGDKPRSMTWGVLRKGIGRLFSAHSLHTGAVPTSNQREEGELQTERMILQLGT